MIDFSWHTERKGIKLNTKRSYRRIKNIKKGPKEKMEKGRKKRR
jgi:hypothetical protein